MSTTPPPPRRLTHVGISARAQTGDRLERAHKYMQDGYALGLIYGDDLTNIDLDVEIAFHHGQSKLATETTMQPTSIVCAVNALLKNPRSDVDSVNGEPYVLSPVTLDLIDGDKAVFEDLWNRRAAP